MRQGSVPPLMARATELPDRPFFLKAYMTINIALFAMMVLVDLRNEAESIMTVRASTFLRLLAAQRCLDSQGNWWRLVTPTSCTLGLRT